jgi:hypothetical protein
VTAQFFDRQDAKNSLNGTRVRNEAELRHLLDRLKTRQPFFAELMGMYGNKLLLGLGALEACVQFSAQDGSPPYVMAVADPTREIDRHVEFLIGNTATPVPLRYCMPYETLLKIASRFVETGERYSGVQWEEI